MNGTQLSMTAIAELMSARGIPTLIDNTGGGCMVLFAGEPTAEGYYPASAGPGTIDGDGIVRAMIGDFYYGPDESFVENASVTVADDATEQSVADLLADLVAHPERYYHLREDVTVSLTLNANTITAYWTGRGPDGTYTTRVFSDYTLDEIRESLTEDIGVPVTFNEPTRNF